MILYHNPTSLPVDAVRLMGASVKQAGSFGRFGTGFKYGIASILRGGGDITIYLGAEEDREPRVLRFETRPITMKSEVFMEVVLLEVGAVEVSDIRIPLGFTTQLGKDWEPWMAHRELACNARDEDGGFKLIEGDAPPECFGAKPGETAIVVRWPELEEAVKSGEAAVFAEGELLYEADGVRVLAGPSAFLYHRGVRVWKLSKPSVFTYDVMAPVDLTEDRTVKYSFCVVGNVRNMLLAATDRSVIAAAVTAGKDTWEAGFDWTGQQWMPTDPGPDWLEEVAHIRENNWSEVRLSKSAADVFLKHSAIQKSTRYTGGSYDEPTGAFGDAVAALEDLHVDMKEVNVFIAPGELPGEALSIIRNGAIYVSKAMLDMPRLIIAQELVTRFFELRSGGDHDTLLRFVAPLFIDSSYELHGERKIMEAREEGLHPTMVERWLGLHPVIGVPDLPADQPDF